MGLSQYCGRREKNQGQHLLPRFPDVRNFNLPSLNDSIQVAISIPFKEF